MSTAKYKADQVWTETALNPSRTIAYNYTPDMLNRLSGTDNGVTSNYSANGLNQYGTIANQALLYDDNFNVRGYNGGTYTHDSANQLVSANNGAVQFVYDGLGRCVKRTVNGVVSVFVFDGWKPILEFDGAGNPQVWNIYGPGPDEILLRITNSALVRYHSDRQGNVAFVLDASGYGIERYTYDAFGHPTILSTNNTQLSTSAIGNRFMYTGREWIKELGIYDYRHRFYHPGLGRFLQTDPIGLQTEGEKLSAGQKALFSPGGTAPEAFSTSEMNLFRYCSDDPVDRSDPSGLETYGGYASGWQNPQADINSFQDRASQGAENNTFGFNSPASLMSALTTASNITRLDLHGHGAPGAFFTGDAKARIYAAEIKAIAERIADGSIDVKSNSEIRLFACGQASMAQYFSAVLGKLGRGDIKVTGAASSVSPNAKETGAKGEFHTYKGGKEEGDIKRFVRYR